jgi:tetratricopeptide (TPR) repeat protein
MKGLFKEMRAEMFFLDGNRYIENGEQVKSIEAYNESIRLNPADFRPYYNLAKIYEAIKENELAADNLKKAIELNPALFSQIESSGEFADLKKTDEYIALRRELQPETSPEAPPEQQ